MKGSKGILIAAYVEGIRTRKDKTVAITLGTQELSPEKAGEIFGLSGHLVTAYLNSAGITEDDLSTLDTIEPDLPGKTPSQRLRAILYLMWNKTPEGFKDKNLHYVYYMERIIEHFKSKLP